jgi:hypothetical protein
MGLLVVGAHRSGTSMFSQVISSAGISLGKGQLMTAAPDNPLGFSERIDVMELNDQLLQDLGGAWDAPPITTTETWLNLDDQKLNYWRKSIDLLKQPDSPWLIKDPRMSLLLPAWDRLALTTLPSIVVIRNPTSAARSLHLRNGFTHRKGLALWWAYNVAILSGLQNRRSLIVDYNLSLRNRTFAVDSIFDFINDNVNFDKSVLDENILNEDIQAQNINVDRTSLRARARKVMQKDLTRNRSTRKLQGIAYQQLEESTEFYHFMREFHCCQDPEFDPVNVPDWVNEELDNCRNEYKSRLKIADLSDRLELANIEISSLKDSIKTSEANHLKKQSTLNDSLIQLQVRLDAALKDSHLIQEQGKLIQNLESSIIRLKAEQVVSGTLSDSLKEELLSKNEELVFANLRIAEQNQSIVNHEESLSRYKSMNEGLKAQASSLQTDFAEIMNQLKKLIDINHNLVNDAMESKAKYTDIELMWRGSEENLDLTKKELEHKQFELGKKIKESQLKSDQIDQAKERIRKLEGLITRITSECNTYESETKKLGLVLKNINMSLAMYAVHHERCESKLAEYENIVYSLTTNLNDLQNINDVFTIEMSKTEDHMTLIQNEMSSYKDSKMFRISTIVWRITSIWRR